MDNLFEKGRSVIRRLHAASHEAFFVGGFVRDRLLGLPTSDLDITTSATVEEISACFEHTILTGEKYGTVTVLIDQTPIEVTTYRTDGTYTDYRRPDEVVFTRNLKEDLARRDFTINQLIMDEDGVIHDHHQGIDDLNDRIIRTIGEPSKRFNEDALRMLRAFRFVSKLEFDIAEETLLALTKHRALIQHVAIERIQEELHNLFNNPHTKKAIHYMINTGFDDALFQLHDGFEALANTNQSYDAESAFTILYIMHPSIETIFKLSKKRLQTMKQLTRIHRQTAEEPFIPETLFTEGLEACLKANTINVLLNYQDQTERINSINLALPIKQVCELAFKGDDIIKSFRLKNRRHTGIIIDMLIKDVINHRIPNEKKALKQRALAIKIDLEASDYS